MVKSNRESKTTSLKINYCYTLFIFYFLAVSHVFMSGLPHRLHNLWGKQSEFELDLLHTKADTLRNVWVVVVFEITTSIVGAAVNAKSNFHLKVLESVFQNMRTIILLLVIITICFTMPMPQDFALAVLDVIPELAVINGETRIWAHLNHTYGYSALIDGVREKDEDFGANSEQQLWNNFNKKWSHL
ncbi:hypothetical protein RB195_019939 [Necator americanus]|uniref:Amino acid transporter transmembrane domain-containing protein n=1 Tax=Necator americanus TaxID=51031 RepID=A0ABR1CI20_NECAM